MKDACNEDYAFLPHAVSVAVTTDSITRGIVFLLFVDVLGVRNGTLNGPICTVDSYRSESMQSCISRLQKRTQVTVSY